MFGDNNSLWDEFEMDEVSFEDIIGQSTDEEETDDSQTEIYNYNDFGSIVYYNPETFNFYIASMDHYIKPENLKKWKCIIIGVVLRTYNDNTYDVLMSGFLMSKPLYLPMMYRDSSKRKYIRKYAKDMFKRYVRAFFKQCPSYEELLNLEITMPEVSEMSMIQETADFFRNLKRCTDMEPMTAFLERFYDNYIYVTHENKIYMMKLNQNKDEKADIIIPDVYPGDFLCVFRHVNKTILKEMEDDEPDYNFFSINTKKR